MKPVALFASLFLLTACATHSSPPPAEQPKPQAVDPRACAPVAEEPKLPPGATVPQPVGEEEQAATEAFMVWVQAALDWGRSLAGRATTTAAAVCHNP